MTITNPLQQVFNMSSEEEIDIEKEYAAVPVETSSVPTEPPPDVKDEDDKLVEARLDEVYGSAMSAFNNQTAYIEVIDPKYAARNAEVAANFLNIALNAATNRANVKRDRKRANQTFIPYNNSKTTNNVIVASREEILRMITVDNQEKKL